MKPIPLKFTFEDVVKANEEWGANCGPVAIAAICGMSLSEVRPYLLDFESKRYTNPTLMFDILRSIPNIKWDKFCHRVSGFPHYGFARIQWRGPWMNKGVPIRARYRQTHWIGVCKSESDKGNVGIFDVNCLSSGNCTGWVSLPDWECAVVPAITSGIKNADGKWSITHGIEITL